MGFNSGQMSVLLFLASMPAVFGCYFFLVKDKKALGLALLVVSGISLRIVMILADPYLHSWDERFHGLVAKNLIDHPFKPMLFTNPVLPYPYEDWGYNHIWVHKQPLFLWQMAASMKLFGINTVALRLPSAILGSFLILIIYDLARLWTKDYKCAFLSAVLVCFSYYQLELISGSLSLEHNDLVFLFYVTCSFWAFSRYVYSEKKLSWAIIVGIFAGLAILNKWLVGLLVFGGWFVFIIASKDRFRLSKYPPPY